MGLDNRLKELNNLPVERRMKRKIYERIHTKRTYSFGMWKEVVLLGAIVTIACFLMLLPSISPTEQQASTQTVEAIYANDRSEEGKFRARPSTLYLGVEKINDPQLNHFFENYTDYVQPNYLKIDSYSIDVVVIRDGEEERWKISRNGILNIDTEQFYRANNPEYMGEMIVNAFYSSTGEVNFIMFYILPAVLLIGVIPPIIYKWRKKDEKSPLSYNLKYGVFTFVPYLMIISWHNFFGPLYKPLLAFFVILLVLVTHIFLKQLKTTSFVYRVEMIRTSIGALLLIILIFNY